MLIVCMAMLLGQAAADPRLNTLPTAAKLTGRLTKIAVATADLPDYEVERDRGSYRSLLPGRVAATREQYFARKMDATHFRRLNVDLCLGETDDVAASTFRSYWRSVASKDAWVPGLPRGRQLIGADECRHTPLRSGPDMGNYGVMIRKGSFTARIIMQGLRWEPGVRTWIAPLGDSDIKLVESVARKLIAKYHHKPYTIPAP